MGTYTKEEITVSNTGKLMKKESRKAKRRRNFSRLLKRLFALAFLAAVLIFAAMSPFFNVTRITVSGNGRYDGQTIIDASGLLSGMNLFRINAGTAAAMIREKCPYIESVNVIRKPPSTITLKVAERKPFGEIVKDGNLIVIDAAGYALEVKPDEGYTGTPRLLGLDFNGYELGKKLALNDYGKLQQVMDLTAMLGREELYSRVTMMDVSGLPRAVFELDGRITVSMGIESNLNYKFSLLKEILAKTLNKDEKGQLEISENGKANFIPWR